MAKCYDNLRGSFYSLSLFLFEEAKRAFFFYKIEGQESKMTFEFIRKLDPYNLDFMDIYSNILFVMVINLS